MKPDFVRRCDSAPSLKGVSYDIKKHDQSKNFCMFVENNETVLMTMMHSDSVPSRKSSTRTDCATSLEVQLQDEKALEVFCQWLTLSCLPGEVWALDGELGAGKTTLVQKLCRVLSVSETVSSPTFVLVNEYTTGPFPIVHGDFYRLGPDQAGENKANGLMLELSPYLEQGNGLILMEWASLSKSYQDWVTLWIDISYSSSPTARNVTLKSNTLKWKSRFLDEPVFKRNPDE